MSSENLVEFSGMNAVKQSTGSGSESQQPKLVPKPRGEMTTTELLVEGRRYEKALSSEGTGSDSQTEDVIDIVRALEVKSGLFDSDSGQIAIKQGQILKPLQLWLQKQSGKKRFGWKKWVKDHIKFMSLRKVETLIQLADRPDLHRYAFLGVHRLLKLLRITKDRVGDDRAGDFLRDHQITIVEGREVSPDLKSRIDEAIAAKKTAAEGSKVQACVKSLTRAEKAVTLVLEHPDIFPQVPLEKVSSLREKLIQLESSITST